MKTVGSRFVSAHRFDCLRSFKALISVSGSYIFRLSSHSRHSPHRSACSLQTFFCKAFTSSTGSPMHLATVSDGIPSARRLLASDNAFSAAPSSRPSARPPCPQVLQRHPVVAKGSSIGSSARRPCPQVPQGHPRVAKGSSIGSSARPPLPTGTSVPTPRL